MPLTNLFLWLILLLSGFIIAALLSAQFKAEQRARRELIHLELHRDSRRSSSQFCSLPLHSLPRTANVLSDRNLKPQTAFLTVEYEPAADSGMPAVSFDWPRADRAVIEHSKQLDHPTESEQHNCA